MNHIPAYHSLYESTSSLLVSNVSQWKPSWMSNTRDKHDEPPIARTATSKRDLNSKKNNHKSRTNTSMYNSILIAQQVNSTIYCSICESCTFSPTVGICIIDPHTSFLKVTEISDSPTFVRTIHKILIQNQYVDNIEILLPQSYRVKKSNFVKILDSNLTSNISINFINDQLFKTTNESLDLICKNVKKEERDSFKIELRHKKFAFQSTCSCINYIQSLPDYSFIHENFNVKYESSEDSMFLSTNTLLDLEILKSNSVNKSSKNISLFKYLNSTVTKMGERLLKNNLSQPLTNKFSLLLRYSAVQELNENYDIRDDIRSEMKFFVDLDNLFSYLCKKPKENMLIINEQKINFILLLKSTLNTVINIRSIINPLNSELLKEILNIFNDENIDDILNIINDYINEDCTWCNKPIELRNQKCYAVKVGHNGLLDASRQLYKSLVDDVLSEIDELSEKINIPLENKYEKNRGFYIFIKDFNIDYFTDLEDSPFINFIQRGNNIECSTMEIVKLNLRIDSVLDEIHLITEEMIDELINKFKKFISIFFHLSEGIGLLDLICSFSTTSTKNELKSSEFDEKNIILKDSRNLLLEFINSSRDKKTIPNDVTIIEDTSRVQIITGPNMSGKSIFIKQFALNVILCQIGMFIPSDFSKFKIFKSLFTRISNDVNEPNMSTFSMEMVELSFILQNANKDSLILIDELGRGTGFKDSISICVSIIQKILNLKSTCLFITHFVSLPKIFQNKPGVFELYMGDNGSFKINSGINWISGYGIRLVKDKQLFPKEIIEDATKISNNLKINNNLTFMSDENQSKRSMQSKLILNYYEMLNDVIHDVKDDDLFQTLSILENEFVNQYDPFGEDDEDDESNQQNPMPTEPVSKNIVNMFLDFGYLPN